MKFALPILAFLLGCGDDGAAIEPASGTWGYLEGDIFDDTCHYGDPTTSPMGTFQLVNNRDGTMTITPPGEPSFACTLSAASFTCPDRADSVTPVPTMDASVHLHVSAYGTFSSPTAAAGHQRVDATCAGTQCAAAGALAGVTFPCGFSVRYTSSQVVR